MTLLLTRQTIWMLAIVLGSCLGLAVARAQDRQPATVAPGTDATKDGDTKEEDIAAGAAEDTLRACMARIPKDASIGQVMIAEQGCWRDENERNPMQPVPGARRTGLTSPAEPRSVVKSADHTSTVVSE
jgi:hypothetical protein